MLSEVRDPITPIIFPCSVPHYNEKFWHVLMDGAHDDAAMMYHHPL